MKAFAKFYVFSIFVFAIFISCKNEIKEIVELTEDKNQPTETAVEIEYFFSENAILKSKMTAKYMERFEHPEPYMIITKGFLLENYDTLGEITSKITSNYAKRFENRKYTEAKNNVVVVDFAGNKTLNTDYLVFDEDEDKIFSDKFVKITTKDKIIFGEGFESDQDFNKYRILKPRGEILINRKDKKK